MEQRHVPKFTSFKRKKADDESISPHKKRDQAKEDRELAELKKQQDKELNYQHRHRPNDSELSQANERGESIHQQAKDTVAPVSQQSDLFTVDRKGDLDNVKYGSNKPSSVPLYREPRMRMLLGVDRHAVHEISRSSNLLRNLNNHEKLKLHTGRKKLVSLDRRQGQNFDSSEPSSFSEADFLSLRPAKRRKILPIPQSFGVDLTGSQKNGNESWQGDAELSDSSSKNDSSQESDVELSRDYDFQNLKDEKASLASRAKLEPGNAQNWLDFISFQDKWLVESSSHQEEYEIFDNRPAAEIKMSIYRDALKSVGLDPEGHERLLMGMLVEAEKLYSTDRLKNLWEDTVEKQQGYHNLALQYLEYIQSNASGFGYDRCRELFLGYLTRLNDAALKASDETLRRRICRRQIHAMLRVTNFLRNCGYQELATAVWQALLERNCMVTMISSGDNLNDEPSADFEQFWDSEQPRIGEESGRGWNQSPGKTINLPSTLLQAQSLHPTPKSEGDSETWFRDEARQVAALQIPIRSTDEQNYSSDDPFRVVFFADIERFLITNQDPAFTELLIQGFLCFLHMPPLPTQSLELDCSEWWNDGLLLSSTAPSPYHLSTNASLFDTVESPFAAFNLNPVASSLCARTISALLKCPVVSECTSLYVSLAEYHIAHLAYSFPGIPKLALKRAQSLLKTQPSSLRLYNAYALAAARSDASKSDHVFATAVTNAFSLDLQEQTHVPLLYVNWVWLSISTQDPQTALERLATYPDNRTLPQISLDESLDRAHQLLLGTIVKTNIVTDLGHGMRVGHELILLALLVYTRTSFSLQAGLEVYADHLTRLHELVSSPSENQVLENIHEARARLIRHHTSTQPITSPRTVRIALEESIEIFPGNSLIRGVWRNNERRFLFDEHVRRLASQARSHTATSREKTAVDSSVLSTLADIDDAISRLNPSAHPSQSTSLHLNSCISTQAESVKSQLQENSAASINTAISVFTRALENPRHRKSPAIWVRYLTFLSTLVSQLGQTVSASSKHNKDKKRPSSWLHDSYKSRLQSAFYEALNAVPSSKRIALFAFDPAFEVAGLLSEDEKKDVLETMEERGLRFMVVPPHLSA